MRVKKTSPSFDFSTEKEEKIRRPPNAFMVFAKEYRRSVSNKNPNVSNKVISSLLGKIWRETSDAVKATYYEKANKLRDLHKARYPGYVYCPRDARLQKLKTKNSRSKKDVQKSMKVEPPLNTGGPKEIQDRNIQSQLSPACARDTRRKNIKGNVNKVTEPDTSTLKHEEERKMEAESSNVKKPSSPGYVPNNPDYFSEYSEDTSNDESSNLVPEQPVVQYADPYSPRDTPNSQCALVFNPETNYARSGDLSDSHDSSRTEVRSQFTTPYGINERLPGHFPYFPYPFLPSFYNATRSFLGPFPCSDPYSSTMAQSYSSFPPPFWGHSAVRPQSIYCQEVYCNNRKPFPTFTSYGQEADFYAKPFGYYDRFIPKKRSDSPSCFGYFNEFDYLRRNVTEGQMMDNEVPHLATNADATEPEPCIDIMNDDFAPESRKAAKPSSLNSEQSLYFKDKSVTQLMSRGNELSQSINNKQYEKPCLTRSPMDILRNTETPHEYFPNENNFDYRNAKHRVGAQNIPGTSTQGSQAGKVTGPDSPFPPNFMNTAAVSLAGVGKDKDSPHPHSVVQNRKHENIQQSGSSKFLARDQTQPRQRPPNQYPQQMQSLGAQNLALNFRKSESKRIPSSTHDAPIKSDCYGGRIPDEFLRSPRTSVPMQTANIRSKHIETAPLDYQKMLVGGRTTADGPSPSNPFQLELKPGHHSSGPMTSLTLYGNKMNYRRSTESLRKPPADAKVNAVPAKIETVNQESCVYKNQENKLVLYPTGLPEQRIPKTGFLPSSFSHRPHSGKSSPVITIEEVN